MGVLKDIWTGGVDVPALRAKSLALPGAPIVGDAVGVQGAATYADNFTGVRIPWLADSTTGNIGGWLNLSDVRHQSPAAMWRTQPNLRTVTTFMARNVAHLGLPAYQRNPDDGRVRARDSLAAQVIGRPNGHDTTYELIYSLIMDLALYDDAYWLVTKSSRTPSGWEVTPIKAAWVVGSKGGDVWQPDTWTVRVTDGTTRDVPAQNVLHFHGWEPVKADHGLTPVETLKEILAEQIAAVAYRQQNWRNGARVGTVLSRPADAPEWSDEAADQFRQDWRSRYTGNGGSEAGGTPILEDGMTLQKVGFSATDEQYIENAKLALTTVAAVYHINPVMVGILDNANYSNVKEFRKMLYGDTLGPLIAQVEARLNTFFLPMIGSPTNIYYEFNIGEKLQGDFAEQADIAGKTVGAPTMTPNEWRALQNRDAVDGGDELLRPLNMSPVSQIPQPVGSAPAGAAAAAPRRQVKAAPVKVKADGTDYQEMVGAVVKRFAKRQAAAVLSRLGAKVKQPDWWDQKRWDNELTADLFGVAAQVATDVGKGVAQQLGYTADDYDEGRTLAFLKAVAESRAGMINAATRDAIAQALDDADNPDVETEVTPTSIFDELIGSRGAAAGLTLATTFASFGTAEAAYQIGGDKAQKTWVLGPAKNPRPEHAAINGETVPVSQNFSNGAAWPGDPSLGADGVANCTCSIVVSV